MDHPIHSISSMIYATVLTLQKLFRLTFVLFLYTLYPCHKMLIFYYDIPVHYTANEILKSYHTVTVTRSN